MIDGLRPGIVVRFEHDLPVTDITPVAVVVELVGVVVSGPSSGVLHTWASVRTKKQTYSVRVERILEIVDWRGKEPA